MTVFEHFLMGGSLGLAAGLHRRFGWQPVALSAVAATLPNWDGLSILFGRGAFATSHRVWGHSLLTAGAAGVLAGVLAYQFNVFGRLQRWGARRFLKEIPPPVEHPGFSVPTLAVWALVGLLAVYSHLLADYFYPGYPYLQTWPIQLLWPVGDKGWSAAIVPGGRLETVGIFVVGMFAVWRWPRHAQSIACLSLICLAIYVAVWWPLGSHS